VRDIWDIITRVMIIVLLALIVSAIGGLQKEVRRVSTAVNDQTEVMGQSDE
jgi:hypothetical protein